MFNIGRIIPINFKEVLFPSLYFVTLFLFVCFPEIDAHVSNFNRIIGKGIINNIDTSQIVKNFYFFILINMLIFGFFGLYFTDVYNSCGSEKKKEIDTFAILGIALNVMRHSSIWCDLLHTLSLFFGVAIFLLICNSRMNTKKIISIFSYILFLFFLYLLYTSIPNILSNFMIMLISISIVLVLFFGIEQICFGQRNFDYLTVVIYAMPLFISVYFEILNILNQHAIFTVYPIEIFIVLSFLIVVLALVLDVFYTRRFDVTKFYPLLIVGIMALSYQPMSVKEVQFDFLSGSMLFSEPLLFEVYETANSSILIDSFLNYGELPYIHHFGAHGLEKFFSGIIYGILNNDYFGAMFSPYCYYLAYPFIALLLYYALLVVTNNKALALYTVLLIPIFQNVRFWGLGLIIYFMLDKYVKSPSKKNAFYLCLITMLCPLYKLDIGGSFLIGTLVALIWLYFIKKEKKLALPLVYNGIICAVGALISFGILCISYQISPLLKLKELSAIIFSSNNWSPGNFSSTTVPYLRFFWFYILIPVAVALTLVSLFFYNNNKKLTKTNRSKVILAIILAVAYLFNFQRGIVRHNLQELSVEVTFSIIYWTSVFYFIVYWSLITKKAMIYPILFAFFVIVYPSSVYMEKAFSNFKAITIDGAYLHKNSVIMNKPFKRVFIEEQGYYETMRSTFDSIINRYLTSDETYFDFCNRTSFYPIMKRKNPVYLAQTPMLLSGEVSQEALIKQLKQNINKVPLIIMPIDDIKEMKKLDQVHNFIRYYKVVEFIYQNYRPFLQKNGFAFFVLNQRYDEFKNKLLLEDKNSLIDWSYAPIELYELNYLSYFWGELDQKQASNNTTLRNMTPSGELQYSFTPLNANEKIKGNYILLEIDAPYDIKRGQLDLGEVHNSNFSPLYSYSFQILKGKHKYIFRASISGYWYSQNINRILLQNLNGVQILTAKILEGD